MTQNKDNNKDKDEDKDKGKDFGLCLRQRLSLRLRLHLRSRLRPLCMELLAVSRRSGLGQRKEGTFARPGAAGCGEDDSGVSGLDARKRQQEGCEGGGGGGGCSALFFFFFFLAIGCMTRRAPIVARVARCASHTVSAPQPGGSTAVNEHLYNGSVFGTFGMVLFAWATAALGPGGLGLQLGCGLRPPRWHLASCAAEKELW